MLLLAIAEIALAITIFTRQTELETAVRSIVTDAVKKDIVQVTALEKDFKCCGATGKEARCASSGRPG